MFKRIIDSPSSCTDTRSYAQYIHSFGLSCLCKIKNIEAKFNQVQEQILKTPFDIIALKVKTMLDCYQVIAHQIYGAFESINLHSLGHSIVKMFLQISSAIRWLIKSFTINYTKYGFHKTGTQKKINEQEKYDKFRQRQINRYMRKGAIEQIDSDEDDKFQNNIYSSFGQSKQNFQKSKNKALAVNSSNLPLILEDTVQYLTKKSQYIEKFIALRQNYEGSHRLEQLLTSQAILQSDGQKSAYATANDKFKQILNKLHSIQSKKVTATYQIGSQTSNITCEKSKKFINTERNKIKNLVEEVEKQKAINKELQLRIDMYEKKISQMRLSQQKEGLKNKLSNFRGQKRRTNRLQTNSHKPDTNNANLDQHSSDNDHDHNHDHEAQQLKQKIENKKQDEDIPFQTRKPKITTKNRSYRVESGFIRPTYINYAQDRNSQLKCNRLKIDSQVIDFEMQIKSKQLIEKETETGTNVRTLNFESNIYEINIRRYSTSKKITISREHTLQKLQLDDASRKILFARISPIQSSSHFSTPLSIKNIEPNHKNKQRINNNSSELKHRSKRKNKTQTSMNFAKKSLKFEEFKVENAQKQTILKDQVNFVTNLFQNQVQSPIKEFKIDEKILFQIFINETNAKNYQLLNIAEICGLHKKIKALERNARLLNKKGSHSAYKIIYQHSGEFEAVTLNLISKKIYSQIIKTKKTNRDRFLSIVLFLRYPFSFLNKADQIRNKMSEEQQLIFDQHELQSHLKRIWTLHTACQTEIQNSPITLCSHKLFILNFFGLYDKGPSQQKTSDSTERK